MDKTTGHLIEKKKKFRFNTKKSYLLSACVWLLWHMNQALYSKLTCHFPKILLDHMSFN